MIDAAEILLRAASKNQFQNRRLMRFPQQSMLSLFKSIPAGPLTFELIILALVTFLSSLSATAQSIKPQIKLSVAGPEEVSVSIDQFGPTNSWSFRDAYAGVVGLGERIEQFQIKSITESVAATRIAPGEFRSRQSADKVSYLVRIRPPQPADLTHISWLTKEYGFLMLADLLPESLEFRSGATVEFELPAGWKVYSSGTPQTGNHYPLTEPDRVVFFVGRGLRLAQKQVRGMELRVVTNGVWNFNDTSVLKSATRVLEHYAELTGFKLPGTPTILLAPFPASNLSSDWKAETRGSTVVLLLNSHSQVKNWIGQLGVIFTHELFHFWVPNALPLLGNYDWFFEGFTSYVALQESLRLKLIGFEEYLNTLGRVYDSYLSYSDNRSLLEASAGRWTSPVPTVYDKGMLAAFIYDLLVRRESNGKSSLADRYRSLFVGVNHGPAPGNDVIISLLTASPATSDFANSYVKSRNRIELEKIVSSFGIDIDLSSSRSRVSVRQDLSNEQKKLLRSLGYRK